METAKTTVEKNWQRNYEAMKVFISGHHQLPDKHKVEDRGLLNWWKYNMKKIRRGELSEEKKVMLCQLSDMRKVKRRTWRGGPDLFSGFDL